MVFASAVAHAQDRPPSQRQILIDLAYVIGESHALRQACEGASDQYWRTRMAKLIETESPDTAFDRRLRESFNTGYVAGQSAHPACDPDTKRAAALSAERGRALTQALIQ